MSEAALSLVSVTKNFGGVRAVNNISMQVAPGERRVINYVPERPPIY